MSVEVEKAGSCSAKKAKPPVEASKKPKGKPPVNSTKKVKPQAEAMTILLQVKTVRIES